MHVHFPWICTLHFVNIVLFHISVRISSQKKKNRMLVGINSLNKRHISHLEVHVEWCTEKKVVKVFVKPLSKL